MGKKLQPALNVWCFYLERGNLHKQYTIVLPHLLQKLNIQNATTTPAVRTCGQIKVPASVVSLSAALKTASKT